MSYILDALKRADSEREREREDVPGLHSKTETWIAPDEVRTRRAQPQAVVWALAAACLLLALGVLWFVLAREAAPASVAVSAAVPVQSAPTVLQQPAPQPAPAVAVIAPAPAVAVIAPAPAVAVIAPAPAVAVIAPAPAVAVITPAPAPATIPAPAPAPAPAPVARAAPQTPAPARTVRAADPAALPPSTQAAPAAPAVAKPKASAPAVAATASVPSPTASAATSAEARLYTLSELPEDVRAGLPALAVGGAMYSQTPANRMLIINGQVFREGDTLAPGVVLEQIKLKSAVLKVKGLRYGISF